MWKYCGNIYQLEFFIHYIISHFSNLHIIHTFFFFFFFFSSTRCPSLSQSSFFYLIPVPFLFYLLPHLDEVVSSHSLFFLQCSHSLSFFFLQYSLSLSLSLSLFLLDSTLILSSFFTPTLSLYVLFFFFSWFQNGVLR